MKSLKQILLQVIFGDFLFRFLPVKKDIVLFSSFFGQHYSDGPRVISEHLHEVAPQIHIYWAFNDNSKHDVPEYVNVVKMSTVKYLRIKTTASYLITNVFQQSGYLSNDSFRNLLTRIHLKLENRKHQAVLTTWHGTPLKKMGNDQVNSSKLRFICNSPMYYVVGNKFEQDTMMRLTDNKMISLLWGSPRLSLPVNNNYLSNDIKRKLCVNNDEHIILFAPTFRHNKNTGGIDIYNSGINQINKLSIKALNFVLYNCLGWDKWKIICRFHNLVEQNVEWDRLLQEFDGHLICGNALEDIRDYFMISDIVITDYSSLMFDFMTTLKPVFLLCHDYDNYKDNERGLYFNFDELPFSFSKSWDELFRNIENYKKDEYAKRVLNFMDKLGYVNSDNLLMKISELIIEGNLK